MVIISTLTASSSEKFFPSPEPASTLLPPSEGARDVAQAMSIGS